MEKQGVIRKVSEHTDWCSSLAYSVKKDGSLRICIDPQKLNQALKRCPHKVSTLEELNLSLHGQQSSASWMPKLAIGQSFLTQTAS